MLLMTSHKEGIPHPGIPLVFIRHIIWIVCLAIMLGSHHVTAQDSDDTEETGDAAPVVDCPTGYFNENCTGVCHCLNGPSQCTQDTGICLDYQCDRGWMDSPYCQTVCDEGRFGSNCLLYCHCQEGDTCDPINGLCGRVQCHPEWTGAGCQSKLPKLIDPPYAENITCTTLNLTWRSWTYGYDVGDRPVGTYTIQVSMNSSSFDTAADLVPHEEGQQLVTVHFWDIFPDTDYMFRIQVNREDNDKVKPGIPGPPSDVINTQAHCREYVPETTAKQVETATVEMTTMQETTHVTEPLTTTETVTSSRPPTTSQPPTSTEDVTISAEITTAKITTAEAEHVTTAEISSIAPTTPELTTVQPTTQPPPVPQPVTLEIDVTPDGDVTVRWVTSEPGDSPPLMDFKLTYQRLLRACDPDGVELPITSLLVSAGTSTHTLTELEMWATYNVTVAAQNVAGFGKPVYEIVSTPEVAPTGSVTSVTVDGVEASSVGLSWEEPRCDQTGGNLLHYVISVWDVEDVLLRTVESPDTDVVVDQLTPYVKYGFTVAYVNRIGTGPDSSRVETQTLQSTPPEPRNLQIVNKTSTSLFVTWEAPAPSNGVLVEYRLVYRTSSEDVDHVVSHDEVDNLYRQLGGLQPFTTYTIQVQARTEADENQGWGAVSSETTGKTQDGAPSVPVELTMTDRNSSCLAIAWEEPRQPNGFIKSYNVRYKVVAVESISPGDPTENEIKVFEMEHTVVCGLLPAAQYRFWISANSRTTSGEEAMLDLWTEIGVMDLPPRPLVINVTDNQVKVTLQPVALREGPVSGYYVVVTNVNEEKRRRKRALQDPTDFIPLPGYTAAELLPAEIRTTTEFLVGDNKTYRGYKNKALTPNTKYTIYYVVVSSLDGVVKMSFSQISEPVQTGSVVTAPVPVADDDDNNMIIFIVVGVVAFILLIVAIVILILCCRERCCAGSKGDDNKDSNWLQYYTNNFADSLPKKFQGNWSDIYEINEPRQVVLHETYLPDDLKVADIHHRSPRISFQEEYKKLPQGTHESTNAALKPQNKHLNNFEQFYPYDHSRVVLQGHPQTDYINANYMNGYDRTNAYIAAQSPYNAAGMEAFWWMVAQEKVSKIVFVARLVEDGITKCEQYWPDRGEQKYGEILVRNHGTEPYANFVLRTFTVIRGRQERQVELYQFISWPDHGVPSDPIPLMDLVMKVKASAAGAGDQEGPVVVHCGTGVSRTAVYIAVDILLDQARVENAVNVYKVCRSLRRNRVRMVRTLKQYVFIYDLLFEALITNHNMIGEDMKVSYRLLSKVNPVTDKSYFREQFEVLEEFVLPLEVSRTAAALRDANVKKNRFPSILPPDEFRATLRTPGGLGRNDYINALFVDSYFEKKAFIVTQSPLPHTIIDFWKMVYDYGINSIVMLDSADVKEETCAQYWPQGRAIEKWDPFFVQLEGQEQHESFTVRSLTLTNAQRPSDSPRKIKQIQFESWNMYEKTPWGREALIQLIEVAEDWREQLAGKRTPGPTLVHCMDGASRSGLYCACAVLCQKIQMEGEVDVFHTLKHLKRRRPHFINSLEQYKFSFKLLWDFLNTRILKNSRRSNGFSTPETDA